MSPASRLKYLYLAYFSAPKGDRTLYRTVRRRKIRKIVELGVGSGLRSRRLIQVAQRYAKGEKVHFTGIDLFEDRAGDKPGMDLKTAYKMFRRTGARSRLIPGMPFDALHQYANCLTDSDLILISADQDAESLALAWFYVPRMLHADSLVLQEVVSGETTKWQPIPRLEIERLAAKRQFQRRRRTAA